MSKLIKYVLWIIIILVVVAAIAITILFTVVDANKFKPTIQNMVYDSTGRNLEFAGDLHWSLWPFGIKVGQTALYGPAGFPQKDFVSVNSASFHFNPLFLLVGHLKITDLTVNGLRVHLVTTQSGANNWIFEAPAEQTGQAAQFSVNMGDHAKQTPSRQEKEGDKTKLWWLSHGRVYIPELNVTNTTLIWDDAQSNSHIKLSNINIHARDMKPKRPFPITMSVNISNRQPNVNGMIKLRGTLTPDFAKHRYQMAYAEFSANLTGPSLTPNGKLDLSMLGNLVVTPNSFAFTDIKLNLNNSQINGFARVDDFKSPDIAFDIKANQFNIDPYLTMIQKLQQESPQQSQPNATGSQAQTRSMPPAANDSGKQSEGLVDVLRSLKLHGTISIGQLTVLKANMQQVHIKMVGNNGVITVDPMTAKLYQGSYDGHFTIDARGAEPRFKASEKLQGVQMQPLLRDMYGFNKLTGSANIEGAITAAGMTQQTIMRSVNGNFSLALRNGTWLGTNFAYYPQVLLAMINKRTPPSPSQASKTDFATLSSSGVIRNGVATTDNIKLISSIVHVDGKGSTNLATTSVDMLLNATAMSNGMAADAKAVSPTLPIKVHGTWSDLKYSPQYQAILTQIATGVIKDQLVGGVATGSKQLGQIVGTAGGAVGNVGGAVSEHLGKIGGMFKG